MVSIYIQYTRRQCRIRHTVEWKEETKKIQGYRARGPKKYWDTGKYRDIGRQSEQSITG